MGNESGTQQDYPIRVHGGDGTTLWEGLGILSNASEGVNTGSAVIVVGSVVAVDTDNLFMISPDAVAMTSMLPQKRCVRMANSSLYSIVYGVAVNTSPVGGRVMLAGEGSIVPVRCAGAVAKYNLIVSATDGVADSQTNVASGITGQVGKSIKPAGTVGGLTDSGSLNYNICLVHMF